MIIVTVQLVSAVTGETSTLGHAVISNDGSGSPDVGHYEARFYGKRVTNKPWRRSRVEGFPRQRQGAWDLLYKALHEAIGGRNR